MANTVANRCTQCGQTQQVGADGVGRDPDGVPTPMVHIASRGMNSTVDDLVSYHLDCLPYELEQAHRAKHGKRIDAAKKGMRGEKLLAVADNDVKVGA